MSMQGEWNKIQQFKNFDIPQLLETMNGTREEKKAVENQKADVKYRFCIRNLIRNLFIHYIYAG